MSFLANLFGYILQALYTLFQNYGIAIILFTIIIKVLLLPLTYKQQVTMVKTAKIQGKLKLIQEKYKNDQEKLNRETLDLYKRENMSPFSGCLSSILQIILILSVFYLVSKPLTFMQKVDPQIIENYTNEIKLENEDTGKTYYPEINIIKEKGAQDETVYLNMEFLGLDLSRVPSSDFSDLKVYIIPALYVISSIISIRITTYKGKKKTSEEEEETPKNDAIEKMNKNMLFIMPIMSVMISMIAPLGLALYWLANNILMILERLIITKVIESKEEN